MGIYTHLSSLQPDNPSENLASVQDAAINSLEELEPALSFATPSAKPPSATTTSADTPITTTHTTFPLIVGSSCISTQPDNSAIWCACWESCVVQSAKVHLFQSN